MKDDSDSDQAPCRPIKTSSDAAPASSFFQRAANSSNREKVKRKKKTALMLLSECWQQRAKKKRTLCALNSVYSSFFRSQYCSHKGSLSICRSQSTWGEMPPILLEAVKHAWQRRNISASESRSHTSAPAGGAASASTNKPIRLYYDLSVPGLSVFSKSPVSAFKPSVLAPLSRFLSLTVCFITGRLEKVHNHLNSHL